MSIESVMPSKHLNLCHPLLLPPSIFPSVSVFSNESVHFPMNQFIVCLLNSLVHSDRKPQMRCLINRNLLLTVMKAGRSRSRCLQIQSMERVGFLVWKTTVCSCGRRGHGAFWGIFYKNSNQNPHDLMASQQPLPQILSRWE